MPLRKNPLHPPVRDEDGANRRQYGRLELARGDDG